MKKTLTIVIATLMLFACGREATFTIVGTVAGDSMEGQTIWLYKPYGRTHIFIDSAKIIGGTYSFTGTIEAPTYALLRFGYPPQLHTFSDLILERGTIRVTSGIDRSTVSGTRNNERRQAFWDAEHVISEKMRVNSLAFHEAVETNNTELIAFFTEKHREYSLELVENRFVFLKNNINNPAGQVQLRLETNYLDVEELQKIIARANRRTLRRPDIKQIVERIEVFTRTAIGLPFVDLTMPDPNGNYISISDFVGNGYLMIDFTATWCGLCRIGKPAMIETFNRFNHKGFNIVSVWFDTSHEAWINGMAALNMPDWPQMSDLRGWNSEGVRLYSINSIPYSVLIDPNGIIIARDLLGDELNRKLEELLGE